MLGTSWQTDSNLEEIVSQILGDTSKVRNYVRNVNVRATANIKLLEPALSRLTRLESIVFQDFSWEGRLLQTQDASYYLEPSDAV